jgi:toxin ParE1/3/4
MKLIFTDEAKFDLDHIGDWIADYNPVRPVTFADEITARCAKLTEMPHAYSLVARHGKRGLRRMVHGDYLILYRVTIDSVEIVRVLHGARDLESILSPATKKKV